MFYTVFFRHHGKDYSITRPVSGKYLPNQYETVVCGLLLEKLELANLSRNDRYVDVKLFESESEDVSDFNLVWAAEVYTPNSIEVKL